MADKRINRHLKLDRQTKSGGRIKKKKRYRKATTEIEMKSKIREIS